MLPSAKHLEHRTKARRDGRIRGTPGVSTYNQGLCEISGLKAAPDPNEEQSPRFLKTTEDEPPFTPLTAEEARKLREKHPLVSPWWVVAGQVVMGLVVALAAWGLTGKQNVGWSAGYGALAVVIPAAIFARGLTGRFASLNAGTAAVGFMLWEMVKIASSIALMGRRRGWWQT